MKKILITGGAGFIGVNAAHYFSNKSLKVWSNSPSKISVNDYMAYWIML